MEQTQNSESVNILTMLVNMFVVYLFLLLFSLNLIQMLSDLLHFFYVLKYEEVVFIKSITSMFFTGLLL